jgi:hypothetical protein
MASAAMSSSPAMQTGAAAVDRLEQKTGVSEAAIMRAVRVIGGALIAIAMITVVLSEVFALDAVNVSSGPFSGVYDTLTTTGPAALTLLVVGLIVLAANNIMGLFGGGGF